MNSAAVAAGTVFQGRYEVVSVLNEGGFGVIYEGRQLTTGQAVAIKLMRPAPGTKPAEARRRAARFERETRLCARLHHPNIVRLVDSGQADAGQTYTVFELVPGRDLARVLADEGALEPGEARHLMLQILDALCCAHGQGVVHRDLKPENIMVVPTGARRNAMVLDFGISTIVRSALAEDVKITADDEILCTPGYAAPEQIRGLPPTARSDLYAWGLVYLECLTGKPVFGGATLEQVLLAQVSSEPIPIPPALARHPLGAILRRATAKDFELRAVTAEGLLRELEACEVCDLRREDLIARDGGERGEPTLESAESSTPGSRTAHTAEGERRLITIVCCALTAARRVPTANDVEDMDEVCEESQWICAEIAQHHRGRVAGGLGEQLLLCFGDPVTREDDAVCAARAALEMAAAIGAASARLTAERGIELGFRAGIHAGIVTAHEGRTSTYPIGRAPQTASRLCALAPPGAIVVGRDVYRSLCGRFTFEVTTLPEASGIYRLCKETPESKTDSGCAAYERIPLFGREQELELLLQRWSQVQQGSGQVVLVIGPPGIGKTRLVVELLRRVQGEAYTCVEARCAPDAGSFRPIAAMLERLIDREGAPEGRLERLEALLSRYGLPLRDTVPMLAEVLSIAPTQRYPSPPGGRKQPTFQALLSLLFAMAEEKPLLMLVEDLHWADPMTLEWLGALMKETSSARVMALFTARPELSPPWPTSALLQLQLGRLERADVERIIDRIAESRALPGAVVERIVERTDGVPLFVEEMSHMVIESGALREEGGRYVLARPLADLAIPATLQGLLWARLDRLGRAKETAQLAAALGREFTQEVLGAVSPRGEDAVREDLDALVSADLVHRRRRPQGETWIFKHSLIRGAAYESIPKRARRRIHARIAATLEERFPEIGQARPAMLMHHHAEAEQWLQALMYAERAAESALAHQGSETEEYIEKALGWLGAIEDEHERDITEVRLNNILFLALLVRREGGPDVAAVVKRFQSLNRKVGASSSTSIGLLLAMFNYHHLQNHRCEARALAERLVAMAEQSQDPLQIIVAQQWLGQCFGIEGRLVEARRCFERLISMYSPPAQSRDTFMHGLDAKAYAMATLSRALYFMGEPDLALSTAEAAVAWARQLDHSNTLGVALLHLTLVHQFSCRREKAAEVAGELIALAERYRLWVEHYGAAIRCWAGGDVAGVELHIEGLQSAGCLIGLPYYNALVASLLAERGQHEAAIERLDRCLHLAEEMGELYYVPELHRLKALSLQALGEGHGAEAEACLRQAIAVAREQSARMPEARATIALCRALLQRDRRDEARALLTEICAWPAQHAAMPEVAEARALLGAIGGP